MSTKTKKPSVKTVTINGVIVGGIYSSGNWTNFPLVASNTKK